MADYDSSNVQLTDQEQITTVLQTEPDASSTPDATHTDSGSITNMLVELASMNCDDESNPTVNAIISNTIENDHPCASDNDTSQLHSNDEENCANQSINVYESFNPQNLYDQISNSEQRITIDQCDSEHDENDTNISTEYETDTHSEDEQIDNENFRVEDFFCQTVSNNMLQASASATMFGSDDQDQHEIESEPTTTHSDTVNQTQQSTTSTVTVPPEPTAQRNDAISMLPDKVKSVMQTDHFTTEIEYVQRTITFNIVLVGPARVGKSSLVNALTGNKKNVAKTSATLEGCTQTLDKYEVHYESLDDVPKKQKCKVYIWDTKGVEDWGQQCGANSMFQFIDQTKPICVIFCAAPGALAKLAQVQAILNYCQWKQILCVTVLTNMWSGSMEARDTVMKELLQLVSIYGTQKDWKFSIDNANPHLSSHTVHVLGNKALCTMVNSQPFVHPLFPDKVMPVQGIDELTHCIMQLLSPEQLQAWCQVVLGNRSFFEKVQQQANGYVLDRYAFLRDLAAEVINDMENKVKNFGVNFLNFFEQLIQ